ncbi:MAG TPA: UDP-N-acetylmuramoyl-L-alanine--D-glutamate ligase [Longimicrobiaceae bacterium]|nr:UDP-N-acetylmuramoyl-L-alanine--D-glutamate ligase [Longimicrobiaceae bacterium]
MSRDLSGESIGVLGLARSGVAAAKLALARGASVYASDLGRSGAARRAAAQIREAGGEAETGRHDLEKLARCDRIVLSPGIPPAASVLREPALAGVPIVPELEFGFEQLDAPVLAVTGTNGKTTTTALLAHLLRAGGLRAEAGGNIGTALSEIALRTPQPEAVAVECSSFQLSRVRDFAPRVGILTNLAPDHLDWYPDVESYYADKARLFRNGTPGSRWVLNGEDERARELPGAAAGERYYFRVATPPPAGERGGFLEDGWLVLRLDGGEERLLRAAELKILGPHNVANALAAAIAARLFGVGAESLAEGLRSFRALPHRLEPVAERGGVLWINDSKATNIASTRVALRSMQRPTILLLGGRHKGEPYTNLLPELDGRVRCVLAYGEARDRVGNDLAGRVDVERIDGSFDDVMARAAALARPGDAVLLSPACSSYDMFSNFEERGRRFRDLVVREEK